MELDPGVDLVVGPNRQRNLTEQELFLEANKTHNNSFAPKFLIRSHKLKFKAVFDGKVRSYKPQDLVIKLNPGETFILRQSDRFEEELKGESDETKEHDKTNDEQGRPIYLFGDTYSPFVSDPHAEIGRDSENDNVWIRDLNSPRGTFINGNKLSPQTNQILGNGDILSLGISHLHPTCKLDQGHFWVFKYRIVEMEMGPEPELDLVAGPNGQRNLAKQELFLKASEKHTASFRPKFLIRSHNLKFKAVIDESESESEPEPEPKSGLELDSDSDSNSYSIAQARLLYRLKDTQVYKPQDLVIKMIPGVFYTLQHRFKGNLTNDTKQLRKQHKALKKNHPINLSGVPYSPLISHPHAEIGRHKEGDEIWIRDLNSANGTFVIGEQLSRKQSRILINGDIVSLGISHLNPRCKKDQEQFWIFKYMEGSLEDDTHLKKLCSQVFGNGVILSIIFSKVDVKQLATFRNVCKLWHEGATPIFKNKIKISLDVVQKWKEHGWDSWRKYTKGDWKTWIHNFQLKTAAFSSLELNSFHLGDDDKKMKYNPIDISAQGVKEFDTFFRSVGGKILQLTLNVSINAEHPEYKDRESVVRTCFKYCKNIQDLKIMTDFSKILKNLKVSSSPKFLTIIVKQTDIEELFQKFPNVVELTICRDSHNNFLTLANSENAKRLLKSLKVLKFNKTFALSPETAKLINTCPIKIEELVLNKISFRDSAKEVCLAIFGFGGSLKKLTLGFLSFEAIPKLCFPKMEKLEFLRIQTEKQAAWNFIWENDGKTFPNLKVINVVTEHFGEDEKDTFLQTLLKEENKKQFPKIELTFCSFGEMRSKNYVSWKN